MLRRRRGTENPKGRRKRLCTGAHSMKTIGRPTPTNSRAFRSSKTPAGQRSLATSPRFRRSTSWASTFWVGFSVSPSSFLLRSTSSCTETGDDQSFGERAVPFVAGARGLVHLVGFCAGLSCRAGIRALAIRVALAAPVPPSGYYVRGTVRAPLGGAAIAGAHLGPR